MGTHDVLKRDPTVPLGTCGEVTVRDPGHATRTAIHRAPSTYIISNTHNTQRCTLASKFRRGGFGGHRVTAFCPANDVLSPLSGPLRGLEVSIHTTWQRLVHSVPRGERIAAAVTFRNVQIGDCTAPWPGDTALPGTRALAVRCHVVNASIGIFVSLRVLSPTSNGVKSIKETLNVSNQNTIRARTAVGVSLKQA